MSRGLRQKRVRVAIQGAASVVLVALLLSKLDVGQAASIVRQAHHGLLVGVIGLQMLAPAAGGLRMRFLVAGQGEPMRFLGCYRAYLVGQFYSVFLPGAIGGDVVRAGTIVSRAHLSGGQAAAVVVVERSSGVLALSVFFLTSMLLSPQAKALVEGPAGTVAVVMVSSIGAAVAAVLITRKLWRRWIPDRRMRGLAEFLRGGAELVAETRGRILLMVFLTSVVFQGMDVLATYVLASSLDLPIPISVFFAVMPLVYLATVLPISLGGLGVREGAFVVLLSQYGIQASDAVVLAFLVYLVRVCVAILGGVLQFASKTRRSSSKGHELQAVAEEETKMKTVGTIVSDERSRETE